MAAKPRTALNPAPDLKTASQAAQASRRRATLAPSPSRPLVYDRAAAIDHLKQLRLQLQNTDWSQTRVYDVFLKHGKWHCEDDQIFQEHEVRYQWSRVQNYMLRRRGVAAPKMPSDEQTACVERALRTLEVLMSHLNMTVYFKHLKNEFLRQAPDLNDLEILLDKCLRIYSVIKDMIKIFSLLRSLNRLFKRGDGVVEHRQVKYRAFAERLLIAMKLMQAENPVFPNTFMF